MCSVNCDGCYAKNHCDVVPNSMNCQEVREDAEKEQRIRTDERRKFAEWLVKNMFNGHNTFWKGDTQNNKPLRMEDFIAEYEKEQNGGKQDAENNP